MDPIAHGRNVKYLEDLRDELLPSDRHFRSMECMLTHYGVDMEDPAASTPTNLADCVAAIARLRRLTY